MLIQADGRPPFSLPHDQDCHELWSKRRKKSMREALKIEHGSGSGSGSKTDARRSAPPEPPSAKPGLTTSASTSSLPSKGDSKKGLIKDGEKIHGLDESKKDESAATLVAGSRKGGGSNPDMQKQLAEVSSLVSASGKCTTNLLAHKLNVPFNPSTQKLLEHLQMQLLLQAAAEKTSSGSTMTKMPPEPRRSHSDVPKAALIPTIGDRTLHMVSDPGSSSSQRSAKGDAHAGVKAALAQLLAQSGVRVQGAATKTRKEFSESSHHKHRSSKESDPGTRDRKYSQQTSYTTNMSISEESNSPLQATAPKRDYSHKQPPPQAGGDLGLTGKAAETMSVKAKVQNFFERCDDPKGSGSGVLPKGGHRRSSDSGGSGYSRGYSSGAASMWK